jgi:5'-nucleotidase (lipoprotein e(P4) family)
VKKLLLASLLIGACASSPRVAPSPGAPAEARQQPDGVHWVRDSAEYQAAALQAFALATHLVEEQAKARGPGSWGVISDADETLLDNSDYQKERAAIGQGYSNESWRAWTRRRAAGAVPGAAAFSQRVRALGGRLAIVTNRFAEECPDSEANLRTLGIVFDALLCRSAESAKAARFELVRTGKAAAGLPPVDVVLYVGDNILDFPGMRQASRAQPDAFGDFGRRFVLIPNPMYGSWESNPRR